MKDSDPGQKWNAKWRGKQWIEKWIVVEFFLFSFSKTNDFGNSKSWRVDWEIWKLRVVDKIGRLEEIWIIFLFARIRKLKRKGRRVLIIRNWKLRDLNYLSFNDKKMRWIILSSLIEFWEYKFRKSMIIQIYFKLVSNIYKILVPNEVQLI